MYIEKVVGFDAREMYFGREHWTPDYREQFLFRDVERPITVDPRIWQSIFEAANSPFTFEGPYQHASAVLDQVIQAVADLKDALKSCWFIAATEFISDQDTEGLTRYDYLKPSQIDPSWRLLGYDVADASWYSFLCDAGPGDKMPHYRRTWGVYLNEYHLFSDASKAQEFADMNEAREPLHGPYAVFGLYLIQSFGL